MEAFLGIQNIPSDEIKVTIKQGKPREGTT
jgi:hypothetical protein